MLQNACVCRSFGRLWLWDCLASGSHSVPPPRRLDSAYGPHLESFAHREGVHPPEHPGVRGAENVLLGALERPAVVTALATRDVLHGSDRSAGVDESNAFSEPRRGPGLVDLSGGDGQHRLLSLVDVGWVRVPGTVIEVDEQDQRRPSCPLVPVG